MSERLLTRGDDRYRLLVALALLFVLVLFGGASRADEPQQALVRAASIAAIAATLWPLDFQPIRQQRGLAIAVAAAVALLVAQLIPLPPDVWSGMPGHDLYNLIAVETGQQGWRPASLTPDLTLNTLGAMLPPIAVGLSLLYLDFEDRTRWWTGLIGLACLSGLLGMLQLSSGGASLHLFRTSSLDSAVGLFANRNHQTAFMACGLPLIAALTAIRIRSGTKPHQAMSFGLSIAGLLLVSLIVTGSRMGLALGGLGAVSGIAIYRSETGDLRTGRRSRPRLIGAVVGLVALTALAVLAMRGEAIDRLASGAVLDRSRLDALAPMMETVRAYWPFGAGFGSFDAVYRRFEPDSLLSTIYLNHAHNEPLELAIEGGVAALLLLAAFLLWWLDTARRTVSIPSKRRRALAWAAVVTGLLLMLSSLVDYPLRTTLLGGLFAAACVELARSTRAQRGRDRPAATCTS